MKHKTVISVKTLGLYWDLNNTCCTQIKIIVPFQNFHGYTCLQFPFSPTAPNGLKLVKLQSSHGSHFFRPSVGFIIWYSEWKRGFAKSRLFTWRIYLLGALANSLLIYRLEMVGLLPVQFKFMTKVDLIAFHLTAISIKYRNMIQ